MERERNDRLDDVLDNEPDASEGPTAMTTDNGADQVNSAYVEHVERLKAEADAQDKTNRLRVAQEQLLEYATQKSDDAESLLAAAEFVFNQAAGSDATSSPMLEALQVLKEKAEEAVLEAKAFRDQQKVDVETLKRSSQKAELQSDVDMKRSKDNSEEAASESEEAEVSTAMDPSGSSDVTMALLSEPSTIVGATWLERARYIPIRLEQPERRLLRLLEAALNVSDYTDKVDILTWRNKAQRIHTQIRDICSILSGLSVFEAGRRYKIMNPDKMRSEYGKLMYLLMDSSDSHVQELLEFKCVSPLRTVYSTLEAKGGLAILEDPLMDKATAEIVSRERSRYDIQRDIKVKEKAREQLAKRYRSSNLSEEEILTCLYSFSDNNSFLLFNRDPIDRMISYFKAYFNPESHEPGYSLSIQGGRGGARLTHNHERQYAYVLQSLTLWREISTDMFKLWYLAEKDMLSESNGYRLVDTGQGLNRVQSAPSVSKAMHGILSRCQRSIGSWVGSSVVHLGDHNVPNAFHFIDKYTQVPRILNPTVLVLEELPNLYKDVNLAKYIDDTFGGVEQCRKSILVDFCRHAFDGSGAENFFDAGSCIDGRLTSAWNWCSKIEKKDYYPIFKLAGFVSFDGDFK
eukprot:gene10312-8243_t